MSVVGEITLVCGWECLLKPVVAWTSAHCFCLIKVLIWPSSDLCVSWLVFEVFSWWRSRGGEFNGLCIWTVYPTTSCITEPNRKRNKSRWAGGENVTFEPEDMSFTGSCAGSFTAGSKVVGQCDTRPYLRASKQMERCLGRHLNPFFHGCQFWNRQQPLKTEVYTAYKDRGPATVPCHVLSLHVLSWVILIKK